MDTQRPFLVSLDDAYDYPSDLLGNKARNLSLCKRKGFTVPDGFSVSTESYLSFIRHNSLEQWIDFELYRKPFEEMRWEELWDISFRIRSAFLKRTLPAAIEEDILLHASKWPVETRFAVRSSASSEDSSAFSFAGIHESYLNISHDELIEKVKLVWASLWSDRSLLYRKEKKLDSRQSTMSVLIQVMEPSTVSGLAFTADPATGQANMIIVEIIRGSLDLLVDNIEEPERFRLEKSSGKIIQARPMGETTLVSTDTLQQLSSKFLELEKIFGQPIDIEWTGTGDAFTVLQVRPITGLVLDTQNERSWYLTLTPGAKAMIALAEKVENILIPEMIKEVEFYTTEGSFPEDPQLFMERLKGRGESYRKWKKIYREEFIPFAHGIRTFGTYYNDLIKPEDPYSFILLLKSDQLLAQKRNRQMDQLSQILKRSPAIQKKLSAYLEKKENDSATHFLECIAGDSEDGSLFSKAFEELLSSQMDVYYENRSLGDDPKTLLRTILSLAGAAEKNLDGDKNLHFYKDLERKYFEKAGPERQDEALNWLRIGRLSWILRDDDNILLGKLENQLLRYMKEGLARLKQAGLLKDIPERIVLEDWDTVFNSLQNNETLTLTAAEPRDHGKKHSGLKPRQLVGQPSSPGTITGKARVIRSVEDFKDVVTGEILVFDAVQPQMTFIISLAGGIVERRGGMLVHSSIIARELEIPAVNGVSRATDLIETGELITVNGDLGLVVIGEPEFNMEKDDLPV